MDTTQTLTHVSLCAGYGGIDLGLKRAIPGLRTILFSEIEAFACSLLVAKMEAGLLDVAPIWTDVKSLPWGEFRDRVDILSGGYPCQPFSAAGKRLGKDDPRHLWPWIADGIVLMRPRLVFFENVEGHISLGLEQVISDLESLGYKATWGIFSASEVGAPHQRKRVFIMAYRNESGLEGGAEGIRSWVRSGFDRCDSEDQLAYDNGAVRHGEEWAKRELRHLLAGGGQAMAHLSGEGLEGYAGNIFGEGETFGRTTGDERNSAFGGLCRGVWPSRPGEPQHGWEPPRVVGSVPKKLADFCSRDSQPGGDSSSPSGEGAGAWGESPDAMPDRGSSLCGGDQGNEPPRVVENAQQLGRGGRDHGDASRVRGEVQAAGSCSCGVGNAQGQRSATRRAEHEGFSGELCPAGSSDAAPVVGNSESRKDNGREPGDLGETPSSGGCCDHAADRTGEDVGSTLDDSKRKGLEGIARGEDWGQEAHPEPQRPDGIKGVHSSETQPPMGGDLDGSSRGMGYAELCISCDNRTDELRMLGNGVVPATAERAFFVLINQLLNE